MADENKVNADGQNLEDVNGGQGGGGYNLTVGDGSVTVRSAPPISPSIKPMTYSMDRSFQP